MGAHSSIHPWFAQLARLAVRGRWLVLASVLLVVGVAGRQVVEHLRIETSPEYFAAKDAEVQGTLSAYRDDFGRDDVYLVLIEGDVFSTPFLDGLRELHAAVEALDIPLEADAADVDAAAETTGDEDDGWGDEDDGWGDEDDGWGDEDDGWGDEDVTATGDFVEVTSLINARTILWEDDALVVRGLLDTPPAEDALPALREEVLSDPQLVGQLVGAEGRHAVIAAKSAVVSDEDSRSLDAALIEAMKPFDREGFRVRVTGMAGLERAVSSSIIADMRKLNGSAVLVMALVLFVLFRRGLAVLGPLLVVVVSVVLTLGAMATVGTPVTLLTNIIPAFLICVGLGDAIHVQSVYRDLRTAGTAHEDALIEAVGSTGMPILYTSLTTMIGLLSFRVASTQGVAEMGTAAAFGVMVAMLMSVTLLPAVLSFLTGDLPAAREGDDGIDRLLRTLTSWSATPSGRRRVVLGAALVGLVGVAALTAVKVFHDPMTWLPPDHETVVTLRDYDRDVGGTANLVVVVDAEGERGVRDRAAVMGMDEVANRLRNFVHPATGERPVSATTSVSDVVRETYGALNRTAPELPDTQRGVSDALLLFETASPEQLATLITTDSSRAHLTVRIDWMDASSYLVVAEEVSAAMAEAFGTGVTARATGTVYTLVTVVASLIGDLLRSFGLALGVVAVMMWALLRRVDLALLALVPNVMPVILVLGIMGAGGIPIDLATLLIASIVLGIAVDDTIHYLHQFRVVYEDTGDTEAAISHALHHAGRAMVNTTIVLAIGFSIYLLSSMANIRRFGTLVAMACVLALVADVIVVPALLRIRYGGPRGGRHA